MSANAVSAPSREGIQPPFIAIRARRILAVWFVAAFVPMFGFGIPFFMLNPGLDKVELGGWLMCFAALGDGLGVVYLMRRLAGLGLPLKHFLGPQVALAPGEFVRLLLMNLALAFGASIWPHLLALSTGKWNRSPGDLLLLHNSDQLLTALLLNPMIVLVAVILAPVCEEIVFRGLLLHRFSVKWGPKTAIWVSSLIFGLMHGLAPGIFLLGLSWSLIYLATRGSLRTTILLHASHNLIVLLLSNSLARMGFGLSRENSAGWLLAEVVLLLLGGGLAWRFYREHLPTWQVWPPFLQVLPEAPAAASSGIAEN